MIVKRWKSISIAKKLYGVIGVMTILIVFELLTLWFAMNILSAVRAFVGGEGLWSKSQKNAAFSLQRYTQTRDEKDYRTFLTSLEVNEGDHQARVEMQKAHPDFDVVRTGFLRGRIHPDDIDPMINLLRRFHWQTYIQQAVAAWSAADVLLFRLKDLGIEYHDMTQTPKGPRAEIKRIITEVRAINNEVTLLEDRFSSVLGEGSRWLERVIITLLSLAVLTVESIGLTLAFITSRSITLGLSEVSSVAHDIGHGNYARRVHVRSQDEIGVVGEAINLMGEKLQRSYRELEQRVEERTAELAKAVQLRDDFMSVASHELKTPLTSLSLQTQIRKRLIQRNDTRFLDPKNFEAMVNSDERQVKRLVRLVDDMLDISRIGHNKLHLNRAIFDLTALTHSALERFALNFSEGGCSVTTSTQDGLMGEWDSSRIEQVIENLFSNALKYGAGKPVEVGTKKSADNRFAQLIVRDHGMGIAKEDQARIFMQFERAVSNFSVSGLGLGLFIANQIVTMHGGKLAVESEEGKGATFTLSLPLSDGATTPKKV